METGYARGIELQASARRNRAMEAGGLGICRTGVAFAMSDAIIYPGETGKLVANYWSWTV